MRTRAALLSTALTLVLAAGVEAGGRPNDLLPRVRPLNEQAVSLLAAAQEKSQTVRDMVAKLNNGDVVAYIQVVPAVEGKPDSGLQFVGGSKAMRFVLIQVAECKAPCRRIELLGHELEHVTEIVSTSWVTDDAQLQRLLTITGWRDAGTARGYETAAAGQVERTIRREVRTVTGSAQ